MNSYLFSLPKSSPIRNCLIQLYANQFEAIGAPPYGLVFINNGIRNKQRICIVFAPILR